jgi:hypothetical protein
MILRLFLIFASKEPNWLLGAQNCNTKIEQSQNMSAPYKNLSKNPRR